MKRLTTLLLVVVVLASSLAACAPATPEVIEKEVIVEKPVVETVVVEKEVVVTATPQELETIKLGLVYQYTGAEALSGQMLSDGAQLAIEKANEAGLIPGYKIETVKRDNATATAGQMDPAQAAANARQFGADPEIIALIGPNSSTSSKAMLPILAEAGLAIVASGPSNPDLTDPQFTEYRMSDGRNVFFRPSANDSVIPPAMATYAHEELGVNTVFLVDDGGAFGVGVCDVLEATTEETGIEIAGRDRVDPQAADYGVLITKIKGVAPDAVFFSGGYLATGKFALQSQGRLDAVFLGTDNVAAPAFVENATAEGAEGWYGSLGSPDISVLPESQEFTEEYEARYGRAPNAFAALIYDGTNALLEVMRQLAVEGQPITREAVRDGLAEVEWSGVTGPMAFDENGDVIVSQITIWQIRNGEVKFVK